MAHDGTGVERILRGKTRLRGGTFVAFSGGCEVRIRPLSRIAMHATRRCNVDSSYFLRPLASPACLWHAAVPLQPKGRLAAGPLPREGRLAPLRRDAAPIRTVLNRTLPTETCLGHASVPMKSGSAVHLTPPLGVWLARRIRSVEQEDRSAARTLLFLTVGSAQVV